MKKIMISIAVVVFTFWGCEKDPKIDPIDTGHGSTLVTDTNNSAQVFVPFEFKDFDNNVYHAIQIGNQVWSKENLKTTHYNDGTPIPCVSAKAEWAALTSGAYCHYNNDPSNSNIYGLHYNYFAVATSKLAPKGWHVATNEDWVTLLTKVGIVIPNGDIDVGPLVDAKDWREPFYVVSRNYDERMITCTNSTGFTALPNGYRDNSISADYPEFDCLGTQASWWTSDGIIIYIDGTFAFFTWTNKPRIVGSGIRLVKDAY